MDTSMFNMLKKEQRVNIEIKKNSKMSHDPGNAGPLGHQVFSLIPNLQGHQWEQQEQGGSGVMGRVDGLGVSQIARPECAQ